MQPIFNSSYEFFGHNDDGMFFILDLTVDPCKPGTFKRNLMFYMAETKIEEKKLKIVPFLNNRLIDLVQVETEEH